MLRVITDEARGILETHQSVSGCRVMSGEWRVKEDPPARHLPLATRHSLFESGIYAVVCATNKPMRLTQAELEAHPAWRRFGKEVANQPPLRGWLAAPFVGRDGRNLGLIQVSDKVDGSDFTANDEAILMQLAYIASVAIENARLYDDLREADRRKDEFLATLAHEVRNPLAPIRNALQIMRLAEISGPVM